MPSYPLNDAVSKWNRVAAKANQVGIHVNTFKKLGEDDIKRVASGRQGMSEQEAELAVLAAAGHPIINQPKRGTGPLQIPGNIAPDIGQIVRTILNPIALGKAIVHEVTDLPKVRFTTEVHSPGQAARNLAEAPGFRLVPGVHTLGGLTTSEGRKELERRPASTLIDVLPIVGAGTKIVGASRAIRAGEVPAAGGVADAMAAGRPLKAAYRALPDKVTAPVGTRVEDVMRALKIDKDSRQLWRAKSEANNAAHRDLHLFIRDKLQPLIEGMNEDERVLLYHEASQPDLYPTANVSPRHLEVLDAVRTLNEDFGQMGEELGRMSPLQIMGQKLWYSTEGPESKVIRRLRSSEQGQSRYESAAAQLAKTEARIGKRSANLEKLIAREHDKIKLTQFQGTGVRKIQAQQRLFRHEEKLRALEHDPVLLRRRAKTERNLAKVHGINQRLMKSFLSTAPAKFHPMMAAEVKSRAIIQATGQYGPGSPMLETALQHLEQGDYSKIFTSDEWKGVTKQVRESWVKLIGQGLDPVWVHSVREHQFDSLLRTTPAAERYIIPASTRAKAFNMAPTLADTGVGLTATASSFIQSQGTEELIHSHVVPRLMTDEQVNAALQPQLARAVGKGIRPMRSQATTLDALRARNYERFDPATNWNFTTPRLNAIAKSKDLYLPKHVAEAVREMTRPPEPSVVGRAARKSTAIFKTSVLAFSPRFLANTFFGNFAMLAVRGHFDDWASMREAFQMARDPLTFHPGLSHGLDVLTADELFHDAFGNTLGKWYGKITGSAQGLYRATEFIENMQVAAAFLGGKKRAARHGLSEEEAVRAGIMHANKTFIDWNGMTGIERQILRQVFPFYSFVRQTFYYVYSLPFDHPYRTSILSSFAENEAKDNADGLPQIFSSLFYLGAPDKMGNVKAIDTKAFDPFNDAGNLMTLRGFFSALHPLAQAVLESGGVNPITGTPQLYSESTIDEVTGKITAKRPSGFVFNAISNVVPQVGIVDHFAGITRDLRDMKTTNPEAYRRQLFSVLGIPFVPYNYNLAEIRGKTQMSRYRVAGQAASQAQITGRFGEAERFNLIPFMGELVNPRALESVWGPAAERLKNTPLSKQIGPVSPKAVLPRRSGKRPTLLTPAATQDQR